jgi:hypothetical protein
MLGLPRARRALGFTLLPVLGCCLALGCGGEKTYRVSGTVKFKGQPIPEGRIHFIPDGSKGNKGQAGYADIKNGAYDTSSSGGRGAVGGAMTVRIEAWDPAKKIDKPDKSPLSTIPPLFPPYETKADLPNSDSTKDFDVPAEAVNGPPRKGLGSKQ